MTDNLNSEKGASNHETAEQTPVDTEVQGQPVADVSVDDLLRLSAEYKNYRARSLRDQAEASARAKHDALKAFLSLLDDVAGAQAAGDIPAGPMSAIVAKLEDTLARLGVVKINEEKVPFDPNIHNAAAQIPDADVEPEHVSKIIRIGYSSEYGLIRAAEVLVTPPAE